MVVQVTAARLHGGDVCVAGHSALALKKAGVTEAQALLVVLGISLASLCNAANTQIGRPVNPQPETCQHGMLQA